MCELNGIELGVVGTKGFVGGFVGSSIPDFGEPLLRTVYAETTEEARAIGRGLRRVSHCPLRIVLLHYAPILDTLEGEPPGIHAFLGSSRLANPIQEYRPDVVLHGHAHAGTFEGRIGDVPVTTSPSTSRSATSTSSTSRSSRAATPRSRSRASPATDAPVPTVSWLSVAPSRASRSRFADELSLEAFGALENQPFHLLDERGRFVNGLTRLEPSSSPSWRSGTPPQTRSR